MIGLSIHTGGQVEVAIKEAGAIAFINKEAAVEELYHTILTARGHRVIVDLVNAQTRVYATSLPMRRTGLGVGGSSPSGRTT